jgi:hypothetical protein
LTGFSIHIESNRIVPFAMGTSRMDYRAYIVDPTDGHFIGIHTFEAPNDEAAIALAKPYVGRDIELWHRGRRIARISGRDGSANIKL